MQHVVIVTTIESGEIAAVFGPYRSEEKAGQVRDLCRNPHAVEYYDYDDYFVSVMPARRYGD